MWKESGTNKYPEVSLHDCMITNIERNGDDISVEFDKFDSYGKYGFWLKDIETGKYYRTGVSQIIIKECDMDDIEIKDIRTHHLSEKIFFKTVYDIEVKHFVKKINKGAWTFEIVYEYYSSMGALYIGQVHNKKHESFWCCIKLNFKELCYFWNEIRYDCPR